MRISSRFVMNLRVRSVHVLSDIVGAWYQGRGRASSIPALAPPQSPEKYGKGLRGTALSALTAFLRCHYGCRHAHCHEYSYAL